MNDVLLQKHATTTSKRFRLVRLDGERRVSKWVEAAVSGPTLPPRLFCMKAPEKELRFTRARQAMLFWGLGVVLMLVAVGVGILSWWQLKSPPPWWLALFPLAAALGAFWLAVRLTRHAYLLLSPVGVEIFPFWKPTEHFQLIPWGEIASADFSPDRRWLTLTLAGYEDVKVILTLEPIPLTARPLLIKAVAGVMEKRANSPEAGSVSRAG